MTHGQDNILSWSRTAWLTVLNEPEKWPPNAHNMDRQLHSTTAATPWPTQFNRSYACSAHVHTVATVLSSTQRNLTLGDLRRRHRTASTTLIASPQVVFRWLVFHLNLAERFSYALFSTYTLARLLSDGKVL